MKQFAATQLNINDCAKRAIIVAHLEDVSCLEKSLSSEGFSVRINRYNYSAEEETYSASIKCLINHASVWKEIERSDESVLVVEADFVPCIGFGKRAVPFPEDYRLRSWGWLYLTGPTVFDWVQGKVRGHSASPVATIISPPLARALLAYAQIVLAGDPRKYAPWDAGARYFVQQLGFPSFLTYRNLGEHGGIANPEHKAFGLRATHRADALASRLHFLPPYARGSTLRYFRERLIAKIWGIGRVLSGRYLPLKTCIGTRPFSNKISLVWFAVSRHFVLW